MSQTVRHIVIEPSSHHFQNNELFNEANTLLNRDGTLLPFSRLKQNAAQHGIQLHTADALHSGQLNGQKVEYWSLGILNKYQQYLGNPNVTLAGFVLMEPPLVAPAMYRALPKLTAHFQQVHVHNTVGDGYALAGVDSAKLRKLDWPQPYPAELPRFFDQGDRLNKLVVIAGAHNPRFRKPEYYSSRIEAVAALQAVGAIDLYGRGWGDTFSRHNAWWPYWKNRSTIRAAYRGMCSSKMDVLSRYRFSLCFENMPMQGYITEKIFDCFYAGTVPVYWGAPDIAEHIPEACYIPYSRFRSFSDMWQHVSAMPEARWQAHREAIRLYLSSNAYARHYQAMERMMNVPLAEF
ncbi:MAG TPA: glycosyltransferase family 10 [Limnobacter sp.]|nr:glycosyltransferase family 10 [Limnobacter sp.]